MRGIRIVQNLLLWGLLVCSLAVQAQVIRVKSAVITADTSAFSVTWAGAGTPVGVFTFATRATADDTTVPDLLLGCGVSDFTTEAATSAAGQDGVGTTDTQRDMSDKALYLTDDNGDILRTLTVTSVTDGVEYTPGESGTQYKIMTLAVFEGEFKAFNAGEGAGIGVEFDITHGLSGKPEAGLFCYNDQGVNDTGATNGIVSFGMFHDDDVTITQKALSWRVRHNVADGEAYLELHSDRVGTFKSNNAGTFTEIELTSNDATNTSFTPSGQSLSGDLVGGLFYLPDHETDLVVIDSPNSTGAYNNNDISFVPGSVVGALSQVTAEDSTELDNAAAGSYSVFASDFVNEMTMSATDENGAATTNTASRFSTEGWLGTDAQVELYAFNGLSADSNGFTATVDSVSATTHKWPFLFFEESVAVSNIAILQHYLENN